MTNQDSKSKFEFTYHLVPGSVWNRHKKVIPHPSCKKAQEVWCENGVIDMIRENGGIFISDSFLHLMDINDGVMFLDGGYGSGKTTTIITKLLLKALTRGYYKCYYGRQLRTLTRELKSNFITEIKRNKWEQYFKYSEEPTGTLEIICIPTGNRFIGFGCDEMDGSKGWDNPTDILVDEVNQITFETFGMLLTRLRASGSELQMIGMFNNSDVLPDHWLVKYIYQSDIDYEGMSEADRVMLESLLQSNIVKHHSRYLDNQFQNPDMYYHKLVIKAGGDPATIAAYCDGAWGVKLNAQPFYKKFDSRRHVGEVVYDPNLTLWVSFDENVNPYLPVGLFQIIGKKVAMVDEIAAMNPNNTLRWVCGEIVSRYGHVHKGGMKVTGDATSRKDDTKLEKGKDFYQLISEYLVQFHPEIRVGTSNPNVAKRGNFINDIFGLSFSGISILIGRQCKHMAADLQNIEEAPDGNGKNKVKERVNGVAGVQRWGHFSDLLDYFMCEAFMYDYQLFQHGNKTTPVESVGRMVQNGLGVSRGNRLTTMRARNGI